MAFVDWIADQLGSRNWVVARRSPRIVRKYGDDVIALSQKRYSQFADKYAAAFGRAPCPLRARTNPALPANPPAI